MGNTRQSREKYNVKRKAKRLGQRIAQNDSEGKPTRTLMSERDRKYDPSANTEDLINDLRHVQGLNPSKHITRTFYRNEGKYSDKTWGARFGTFQEFRREAGLEHHRGAQRMERDIASHAAMDRYRGFYEIEILPWVGKYEQEHTPGMKTILVGSDFHDVQSDPFVLDVFLDAAKRAKPNVIILNGDVFEFAQFSKYNFDPRAIDIRAAFEFVRDRIFSPLRELCPDAQIDFIIGNHDWRILHHMADRTPYIVPLMDLMGISLSQLFGLDAFKINLICKADFSAYQIKDSHVETKKNYKVYFETLLVGHHPGNYGICSIAGHTHAPLYKSTVNELAGAYFQLTLGCIAKVDFEYVKGLNHYSQSFALVHINPETRECVPEHVVFTHNFCVFGGVVYRRPIEQGGAA